MKNLIFVIGIVVIAVLIYQVQTLSSFMCGPIISKLHKMDNKIERHIDNIAREVQFIKGKTADFYSKQKSVEEKIKEIDTRITGLSRLVILRESAEEGDDQQKSDGSGMKSFGLAQINIAEICLRKAEELLSRNEEDYWPSISILLQRAGRALGRAYTLEKEFLPSDADENLKNLSKILAQKESDFNRRKSQQRVDEFYKHFNKATDIKEPEIKEIGSANGEYCNAIRSITEHLKSAEKILSLIYDTKMRNECERNLEEEMKRLQGFTNKQYFRYQEYAIYYCKMAIDKYREYDKGNAPTQKEVERIIPLLCDINESYLSPEVARLYHDILGKCIERLGDKRLDVEIALAEHEKKSLKDF